MYKKDNGILTPEQLHYFYNGLAVENPKFWSRFSDVHSFKEKSVLDVGCGHGAICIDVILKGAKKAVGIDINETLITFAKANLLKNFPEFKNNIDFFNCDINGLNKEEFDIIVSKDSFEHILNVDNVLKEMRNRLRLGGKIYIGFAPLYNSPFGDHNWSNTLIPWGHIILPESYLIQKYNKHHMEKINTVHDLGLNKLSLRDFKRIFQKTNNLQVVYFKVNHSNNSIVRLFSLISRISFLQEYFTHNLYCILEKSN